MQDRTRDKALLLGFSYPGTKWALTGIDQEIIIFRDFLIQHRGYLPQNVLVVLDSERDNFPRHGSIRAFVVSYPLLIL